MCTLVKKNHMLRKHDEKLWKNEWNMKKKKISIMVENAHYMSGIAYITLYADGIIPVSYTHLPKHGIICNRDPWPD